MQKPNPDSPRLTENDREVLKKIIDHSKIPDAKIAEDIGISTQAVFKIRTKLEQMGIIKGYAPIIDFKKIGIHVLAVLILRIKPKIWNQFSDDFISNSISKFPHMISSFRIADANATHILILGFKDNAQREQFIVTMQTKNSDDVEIKDIYTFSVDKVINMNSISLLHEVLDKNNECRHDLFPLPSKSDIFVKKMNVKQ
jgi:DNA-binding Lrp family transcriptional regulator